MRYETKLARGIPWIHLIPAIGIAIAVLMLALRARAQTNTGWTKSAQTNTDYFVGTVPYGSPSAGTIQAAATAACANTTYNHKGRVVIPVGVTATTSPTAATGCAGVSILDESVLPWVCYAWGVSGPYTAAASGCAGGGGSGSPTGPAGGALAGTYPNPTIAGLGFASAIPVSDGAGNLVASNLHLSAYTMTVFPASVLTMSGSYSNTFNAASLPNTSVVPNPTLKPNYTTVQWPYEFVSAQGTAPSELHVYDISSGQQVAVGATTTFSGCASLNGIATTNIAGVNILVTTCFDNATLYTFSVSSAGVLTLLGSVSGLTNAFPGLVIVGTDVYVPLFGTTTVTGSVAKVSIATPASPTITTTRQLRDYQPCGTVAQNPQYLSYSAGYIYAQTGHLSCANDNTLQVLDATTMTLVGTNFILPHSSGQNLIQGNIYYIAIFDSKQVQAIDITDPTGPVTLGTITLSGTCSANTLAAQANRLYVGCFNSTGLIKLLDVSNPGDMQELQTYTGYAFVQRFATAGRYLMATGGSSVGNSVWMNDMGGFYTQQFSTPSAVIDNLSTHQLSADSVSVKDSLTVSGNGFFGHKLTLDGITTITADTLDTAGGDYTINTAGANLLLGKGGAGTGNVEVSTGFRFIVADLGISAAPICPNGSGGVFIVTTCLVPVGNGGTGANTLANHGVVLGQATSPVHVTAVGATNSVFIGQTGADPIWVAQPAIDCTNCTHAGFTNPMTTVGDTIYGGASGAPTRLAGFTVAGTYALCETPTGVAVAPTWCNMPITKAVVASNFLTGYSSVTGLFTAAQPAFTDISGQATLGQLPTLAANTVLGALTATTPSGLAVPSCSTAARALQWTSGTGFGCNMAVDAATLLTGTWAAPGTIGSGTPNSGQFTTLTASTPMGVASGGTGASTFGANRWFGNNTGSTAAPGANLIGASDWSPNAYIAGAGSVNVMTATLVPAVTALVAGLRVQVLPNLANTTTTPTLNVNGLGAKTITKNGTAALIAGDYTTTAIADFEYDGTEFQLLNPQTAAAGGGTAWSAITNPIGNLSLAMGTNTTTFTASTGTSTSNLWTFQDTTGNTGTGDLMKIATIGTSTMVPLEVQAKGATAFIVNADKSAGFKSLLYVNATSNAQSAGIYVGAAGGWFVNSGSAPGVVGVVSNSGVETIGLAVLNSNVTANSAVNVTWWMDNASFALKSAVQIASIPSVFTAGSESADMVVRTIKAGTPTESARSKSTGDFVVAAAVISTLGQETATATLGTGVTSATCQTATCTLQRGSYTVVGGTATTGTIVSLAWGTTTTAWVCTVDMNGGTGFLGVGNSVATTTGMNVTAAVTVIGTTFTFNYSCQP